MKFTDIFKVFSKSGKTVHKSVKGSLKFMDDILEKEYIVGGIDNLKEATGKIVEKSGEFYENAKHSMEGVSEDLQEKYAEVKEDLEDKYEEVKEDLEEKYQEVKEDMENRISEEE